MKSSDWLDHCKKLRGGITESEAAIIADLAFAEKRADIYAAICRGVGEAIGLDEGSSWSDLPGKVKAKLSVGKV